MDTKSIIQQSLDYSEENLKTEITAAELAEAAGFPCFTITGYFNLLLDCR